MDGFLFGDFILFARLRCLIAFQRIGFESGAFEKYPTYFRDDSILELAQSGIYQGASAIEEFASFLYAGASPYYACCNEVITEKSLFLRYNDGQCEFLNLFERTFEPVPNTTAPSSMPFQYVGGTKLYFDFQERYITRTNLIFTDDLLRLANDAILNSANTRQYVCGVMNGVCANTLDITANESNLTCEEQLATLPTAENKYYTDGNSQGCRTIHAAFAATNPDHCAHLSFAPLEDPNGNIKCQTTKGTQVTSLFTEREIQMYKDFATSVNIDPEKGHNSNQ